MPERIEKTKPTGNAWARYLFLLATAVFLYMFLFELPATPFFGDGDQSIFLYEAERLFNGEVMYRDFFEFTLPGTQAFYAAMFAVFGVKFWIVGATVLIAGTLTAALTLAISRRVLPSPLYFLPATIYIFFGFRWIGFDGSHRMLSPIFVLIALWLLVKGTNRRNLVLAGCSLGAASFFTQQRGFIVLAAILVFLLLDKIYRGGKWTDLLRSSAAICASFAVTLIALCLYFVIAAGPENFFYATVVYPFKYYGYGHPNQFGIYFIGFEKALKISSASDVLALIPVILHCVVLPFACLALVLVYFRKRRGIDWDEWRGTVLIALTGFFLTITTTAPDMFRLFPISPLALIVSVWLFYKFGPSIEIKRRLSFAVIALFLMLGAFQAVRVQTNWKVLHLDLPVGRLALVASKQAERYQWLAGNTSPGDYFFEVYEPFVYFPLRLKNPTKVGQFWPSEYTRPEQVAEAIRDLAEKRPRFILWDNSYFETPRSAGDNLGPLADFVLANYAPIGEVYDVGGKPVQFWEIKTIDDD
jgi:hypothetical protein